jgi:pimeloyl-ACP methyl ester carboxylesterase
LNPADTKRQALAGLPLWQGDSWNGGADAIAWPSPLSSFQVIDDLMQALSDRTQFAKLERITLAGHSGGGQLVHRYAVLNNADEKMRAAGISVRYIVANPSTYLYFTPERPHGSRFAQFDASACPEYNDYKYGIEKMVRYARTANTGIDLFKRYATRDVTYLLGTSDTDPNHRALDKSCSARAGGAHRLERGRNYIRYERYLAGTSTKLDRHGYEVIGVGHSQARMFGSRCSANLLFGLPEEQNTEGAQCRAVQLDSDA